MLNFKWVENTSWMSNKYHKKGTWEKVVLPSWTFPSKSHVLSINRDEVTLFQVRAIRYDLRIFGLCSPDTGIVRPLCALWGFSPLETLLTVIYTHAIILSRTINWTPPPPLNYILMYQRFSFVLLNDYCPLQI